MCLKFYFILQKPLPHNHGKLIYVNLHKLLFLPLGRRRTYHISTHQIVEVSEYFLFSSFLLWETLGKILKSFFLNCRKSLHLICCMYLIWLRRKGSNLQETSQSRRVCHQPTPQYLAGDEGVGPPPTKSKFVVLPLHQSPKSYQV